MPNTPEHLESITSTMFEIMLALAGEPKHGYAIMRDIEIETEGRVQLPPVSLYRTIRNLIEFGWIERVPQGPFVKDARRQTYRLTAPGRRAASTHAHHLASLVEKARERRLLNKPQGVWR